MEHVPVTALQRSIACVAAILAVGVTASCPAAGAEILIEAEAFGDYGGWVLDAQFMDQMGSPYLLAHGLGTPVEDAKTRIEVSEAKDYRVWVRAKDWVPSHHPGRFRIRFDGKVLDVEFGANGKGWVWQDGGTIRIGPGTVTVELEDLTGFDGRCDAILLTTEAEAPPAACGKAARTWRKRLLGLSDGPAEAGDFDVVVVGGGIAGCASTLAAARLGCRVALVQNRPQLGGNGSKEVGIGPKGERGASGSIVDELTKRQPDGDLSAREVLEAEPNVSLFLEHHAYAVVMDGRRIVAVDAHHTPSGVERRLRAPVYIDCTGRAAIGILAGAKTRFGREARSEFGETLAPKRADRMHHGNTVTFRTRMADRPAPFPDVPWATVVAKDYAELSGQVASPGNENRPGPAVGKPEGHSWTHFWEYGQWLDPDADGEEIRDHLFRALYGALSNVKQKAPERYANLVFDWVAHVPATGESRRLEGDYILTENDLRSSQRFPDAVAVNRGIICLHYPGHEHYDFRLGSWNPVATPPYLVPFRCLYSCNLTNLMMAGKHISVTHVAGASTKMMLNGGQHGVAVGSAAYLCKKYETTPRGIGKDHIEELQSILLARGQYRGALRK